MFETNLIKAVEMASRQSKVADDFTATFPRNTVQQWRQMVEKWQANPLCPNPYVSNERGVFFRTYFVVVHLTIVLPASKLSEVRL